MQVRGHSATSTAHGHALCDPAWPALVMLLLAFAACVIPGQAQSREEEYRVKAAFLFHFAQLVTWPESTSEHRSQLVLCTYGDDPFHGALEATVAGKQIGALVLAVRHVRSAPEARDCQVLFLSGSQKRLGEALVELRSFPILTVSEADGFLEQGGMIRLWIGEGKVRFDVNRSAAEQAGLKIGSRLLLLAQTASKQGAK